MTDRNLAKLRQWLESQSSAVRCVFSETPEELPAVLENLGERASSFSLVSMQSEPDESMAEHLDTLVQMLAEAVLARYPQCYRSAHSQLDERWASTEAQLAIEKVIGTHPRVSPAWLRLALAACRVGECPRFNTYSLSVEAEQLALWLDPSRLLINWVVPHQDLAGAQLLGLARSAEWLQAATHASVVVALSMRWYGRSELDSISYEALSLDQVTAPNTERPPELPGARGEPIAGPNLPRPPSTAREVRPHVAQPPSNERSPRVMGLWPLIGRPHPLSPPEQLFAVALASDPELASMFKWNQVVVTDQNTRPIVDLLCEERRLAVEIDGFAHHSSRAAFEQDRQRDWELLVTGYRVLRIPAAEVLSDTRASLEKVRVLTRSIAKEAP